MNRPRILVVDDEREACDLIRMTLDSRDFRTEVAHDGVQAWISILESPPHVVVLDIQLPGINGYELLTRIRKTASLDALPVVLVTGLTDASGLGDTEWARVTGADALFSKPFDPDNFVETVRRLATGAVRRSTA
jgi:DNA-binding response OmpR family regulator